MSTTLEQRTISWSIAVTAVVVCVCICILVIVGTLFGVAELKAHWP